MVVTSLVDSPVTTTTPDDGAWAMTRTSVPSFEMTVCVPPMSPITRSTSAGAKVSST